MEAKQISKAVIKRLPRYYRYLGELMEDNVERISSNDLSKKMRVTASQIRQDLNNFGGFGQQGYGYNVKYLYTEIGKILGLDTTHPMIIVGAGNLGQALANYVDFEKRGFRLMGIFDINPVLEGIAVRGIEIQMISELPFFLKENNIEIAILTLPKNKAGDMANILIENGIKAIWNFAHIDLDTPDDVIVENVHLSESLMTLSYNLSQYRQEHGGHTESGLKRCVSIIKVSCYPALQRRRCCVTAIFAYRGDENEIYCNLQRNENAGQSYHSEERDSFSGPYGTGCPENSRRNRSSFQRASRTTEDSVCLRKWE